MSSNVGLSTPRGSGTSGYVQRNLSHLRPRDSPSTDRDRERDAIAPHKARQPDAAILAHDRARAVEVQVFELREGLEDEGIPDDEIEAHTSALRTKLLQEMDEGAQNPASGKGLKVHQVHERAAAKAVESERLRRALGIRADYEEGAHWREGEERLRGGVKEEGRREVR